jgi:hypothetical protein
MLLFFPPFFLFVLFLLFFPPLSLFDFVFPPPAHPPNRVLTAPLSLVLFFSLRRTAPGGVVSSNLRFLQWTVTLWLFTSRLDCG